MVFVSLTCEFYWTTLKCLVKLCAYKIMGQLETDLSVITGVMLCISNLLYPAQGWSTRYWECFVADDGLGGFILPYQWNLAGKGQRTLIDTCLLERIIDLHKILSLLAFTNMDQPTWLWTNLSLNIYPCFWYDILTGNRNKTFIHEVYPISYFPSCISSYRFLRIWKVIQVFLAISIKG